MRPFIRSAYNYDSLSASRSAVVVNDLPSMAVQSEKDASDINVLVKRFGITGQISGVQRPPSLEEFGEIFDFRSAMDTLNEANRSFMSMSADTRARFLNDPARFVEFCSKAENLDEMRKLGLAVPEVIPEVIPPMKVEVVNPSVPNP